MSYLEQLNKKLEDLRVIIEKEKKEVSFDKIQKPSMANDVLSTDFSELDNLSLSDLRNYLGVLSQHLIFINKYINQINAAYITAKDFYEKALAIESCNFQGKTFKEKESQAIKLDSIIEIKDIVNNFEARLAVHKNEPEVIKELIQSIKKVMDAKSQESRLPE